MGQDDFSKGRVVIYYTTPYFFSLIAHGFILFPGGGSYFSEHRLDVTNVGIAWQRTWSVMLLTGFHYLNAPNLHRLAVVYSFV